MSDEPKVEITSEPGEKNQFGKGWFQYQNAKRHSTTTAVVSLLALAIAVCGLVLSGGPDQTDSTDQTSRFLNMDVPTSSSETAMLSIPKASDEAAPDKRASAGGKMAKPERLLGPELLTRPKNVSIPPGSMVAATLISGASDGPVKAELKEAFLVAGETLLPAKTILFGQGQSGEERLVVRFNKAVFRDGTFSNITAEAVDSDDKIPGLKGSRIGYRAIRLGAAIGLNFIGGFTQGLQEQNVVQGAVVNKATMKNALLNGASKASVEEGQAMMSELHDEKPVINVGAGTPLLILFSEPGSS